MLKPKATRSRSSCACCKKRRKKCDQAKPKCSYCATRGIPCDYSVQPRKTVSRIRFKPVCVSDLAPKLKKTPEITETSLILRSPEMTNQLVLGRPPSPDPFDWAPLDLSNCSSPLLSDINEIPYIPVYHSPQLSLPIRLNQLELSYFDHYCNSVATQFSIVPREFNYFLKVFLPMALQNEGVLACLIAWGCIFKNGGRRTNTDRLWITRAMGFVNTAQQRYGLTREVFIASFACYMILMCLEISVGDTDAWSRFLTCGYDLINSSGCGFAVLKTFASEGHLLAENFAYFDILASQSHDNGTYYGIDEYEDIYNMNKDSPLFDSLQGCIRPLILKLGEVVNLVRRMKLIRESNDGEEAKMEQMMEVLNRAAELDAEVENAKPNPSDFEHLIRGDVNLEQHLTVFELYQYSIQIHLRQSVRRLPPVVPEIQVLLHKMKGSINVVIDTSLKSSLCFPLLIAGLSSVTPQSRKNIKHRINYLISNYEFASIKKVLLVIEEVWRLNMDGTICVDWFRITKKFGWRLNLGR